MAYLQTAALITRIGEVIEDSAGSMRTVPAGRFTGTFPQGLSEPASQRRSLVNPRVRVNVNTIGRSQYSPPINSNLIIYDIEAVVTASRLLPRENQLNPDDYDATQAAGAEDTDVIRQALEWPANLEYTEAGAPTDLVSGMLAHIASSFVVIGQIDAGAQRLEGTHSFKGWMVARPDVYRSVTFTASGTWTVPAGVTAIVGANAWGGGGGGGAASASYGGGGGGGGGTAIAGSTAVSPGDSIVVTIGAGGAAGASGGDTTVVVPLGTLTAHGGVAGSAGGVSAQGAGGAGGAAGSGGLAGGAGGGGGTYAGGGGGGGGAGTGGAGSAGTAAGAGGNGGTMGGVGGTRDGGRGGNGAAGTTAAVAGGTPGAGGGGASTGAAAAAGASGRVVIYY